MEQRTFQETDLRPAFFDVDEDKITMVGNDNRQYRIHGLKAIVDKETQKVISVVSDQYNLVSNQDAYKWADFVVHRVFNGRSLSDFICYNLYMPKTKASCRIDLIIPQSLRNLFGDIREDWTPFIRISNSYNKTLVLKYEIGFCRWICLNGVIFDQKGITISIKHSERIDIREIEQQIAYQNSIQQIDSLWNEFAHKMNCLKNTDIPVSVALPMFCKAFGIKVDKNKVSERQKAILGMQASQIIKQAKSYFKELGNNAYAMFNVLTDYASYPDNLTSTSILIHGYQKKVGNWADDLIHKSRSNDFSLYDYIGKEAMDSALYLETLTNEN